MVVGTISEYTWHSRTRRAISCAYWAPKSTTRTVSKSLLACTPPLPVKSVSLLAGPRRPAGRRLGAAAPSARPALPEAGWRAGSAAGPACGPAAGSAGGPAGGPAGGSAGSSAGCSAGLTRTRAMRRPSISSTVSTCPATSTVSPSAGSWPSVASMYPATVSYGPSGSSIPVCSANSSRLSRPSTSMAAAAQLPGLALVYVVLVLDVADQLLDQVLQGDDAGRAAVLVHHDGQVRPVAAHLRQRGQHGLADRQQLDRPADLAPRSAGWSARPGRAGHGRGRSRSRRRRTPGRPGTGSTAPWPPPRRPRPAACWRPGTPPRSGAPAPRGAGVSRRRTPRPRSAARPRSATGCRPPGRAVPPRSSPRG